jgi:flagellar biosynthesis protein FlhF
MRIKSYFCASIEEAIGKARSELGEDAMLLESRKALAEARHLGEYEVVFAVDAVPQTAAGAAASGSPGLAGEVAGLKKQLEGMRRALTKSAFAPGQWLGAAPELSEAYALLAAHEVAPELATEIVQAAASRAGWSARPAHAFDAGVWSGPLAEEIESRVRIESCIGRPDARPRIVALVGPPGAGKTATLVKLAVKYGLACRRPALLASMDTYRVAAADQLRAYAVILGVGFQLLETVTALAQTLAEHQGKDLILIDTPGLGFSDLECGSDLARFLSTRADIDTQLVLSSSMKSADLSRVVDAYEIFQPGRLLFTRLDETTALGPILNESVRTGKPLSFFSAGQRIPEDLEPASARRLTELIFGARPSQALTAA